MSTGDEKIHIIGVGNDGLAGLTSRAKQLLTSADLVLGNTPAPPEPVPFYRHAPA